MSKMNFIYDVYDVRKLQTSTKEFANNVKGKDFKN